MTRHGRATVDVGNASIEIVFLAAVLISLIALVIAFGRVSLAQGAIAAAARDAARQASIAQSPGAARTSGEDSALAALRGDHLTCDQQPTVRVDTSQFGDSAGQEADVTATVTCRVQLSDLWLPGLPGATTITATFTSPLNPFEARFP
jgi:Flp pilus assembly protein TadG